MDTPYSEMVVDEVEPRNENWIHKRHVWLIAVGERLLKLLNSSTYSGIGGNTMESILKIISCVKSANNLFNKLLSASAWYFLMTLRITA